MKKKMIVLLVLAGLISSCGAGKSRFEHINITNNEANGLASDPSMSVFSPSDFIIVNADVVEAKQGDEFTGKVTAVDAPGFDPGDLLNGDNISTYTFRQDIEYAQTSVGFLYNTTNGWPIGSYEVEVYFNGKLDTVLHFEVR
jgi:hypothetical protein